MHSVDYFLDPDTTKASCLLLIYFSTLLYLMSDNNNNIVKMSVDVETSTTTTSTITTTNTNAPIAITAAMFGIPNTAPTTLFGQPVSPTSGSIFAQFGHHPTTAEELIASTAGMLAIIPNTAPNTAPSTGG